MATETGKPNRDGRAEIEKCAWVCDYYADNALTALQPDIIETDARCLLGGEISRGDGAFYPATVLGDVQKGMPAYDEETFGPVAVVIGVKNESEAIRTANDTSLFRVPDFEFRFLSSNLCLLTRET